jgi:hypothetical protein
MSDFITFADERLADHELVDQGHVRFLSIRCGVTEYTCGKISRRRTCALTTYNHR